MEPLIAFLLFILLLALVAICQQQSLDIRRERAARAARRRVDDETFERALQLFASAKTDGQAAAVMDAYVGLSSSGAIARKANAVAAVHDQRGRGDR